VNATILVAAISFLGCSIAAQAHQINLTNARLVVLPDRSVDVEIAMKGSDADRVAGTKVFDDATGFVQPAALAAASASIGAYIARHTAVLGKDAAPCGPGAAKVAPDGDGVVVSIPWFCAGIADPLRYRSTVLTDVSPDARQVVLIGAGPDAAQDLMDASRTDTVLTAAPPPTLLQVIGRYTEAGIEHIFLGYESSKIPISRRTEETSYISVLRPLRAPKCPTLSYPQVTFGGGHLMKKDELSVDRLPQADYAVRRPHSQRVTAVKPTQRAAIARDDDLNPEIAHV
jgi:hypothetical protein